MYLKKYLLVFIMTMTCTLSNCAPDIDKCGKEVGLVEEDWKQIVNTLLKDTQGQTMEFSEKILCFLKCSAEDMGITKADGSMDIDKIKAEIKDDIDEEAKNKMLDCLGTVDKIVTCQDIKAVHRCMPTGKILRDVLKLER